MRGQPDRPVMGKWPGRKSRRAMPEAANPGRFAAGIPSAAIDALAADWQAHPNLRTRLFAEWQAPSGR